MKKYREHEKDKRRKRRNRKFKDCRKMGSMRRIEGGKGKIEGGDGRSAERREERAR